MGRNLNSDEAIGADGHLACTGRSSLASGRAADAALRFVKKILVLLLTEP